MISPPDPTSDRPPAFTLIELLATVAIVGLLAAILTPTLNSAISRGKAAKCVANLRQIGVAVSAYAGENNAAFPRGGWGDSGALPLDPPGTDGVGWLTDIYPYLDEKREIFVCPEGEETSPSGQLSWMRMPGKTMADPRYPSHYAYNAQLNTNRMSLRNNNPPLNVDRIPAVKNLSGLPVMIDIVFQTSFLGYDSMFASSPSPTGNQVFAARHSGRGNILWGDGRVSSMSYAEWASAPDDRLPNGGGWKKYKFCMGEY